MYGISNGSPEAFQAYNVFKGGFLRVIEGQKQRAVIVLSPPRLA